ncbi:AI-2E family transporter [Patescibacteria group bacterium]|nr:AI-2E family transporter [Patescibacteria group bacterium]
MSSSTQKVEISWTALWRIFIFIGFALLLYFGREAFAVLLVGVVLSLGIEPLVGFLSEKFKFGRVLAIVTVFIVLVMFLGSVLYFILPVLMSEFGGFVYRLNQIIPSLPGVNILPSSLQGSQSGIDKISSFLSSMNFSVTSTFWSIIKDIVLVFSALIVTLYLSVEKHGAERMLRVILPDTYEASVMTVFKNFEIKMRRWFATQLALSLFVGLAVFVGMFLIGVRYPVVLGILAGILEIVPVIGPIITGTLAFVIAASDSVSLAIYAVIFFILVQQLENHVLVPLLVGKSMRVHPVIVLVSVIAGGEIAGITGIILSVPIAVLAQEIFDYLAERKSKKLKLEVE